MLDYSKVDFKKFSPSSLDDINDLNFATLGKNYKQHNQIPLILNDWDEIDYSTLNNASKAIDWALVLMILMIKSNKINTFDMASYC